MTDSTMIHKEVIVNASQEKAFRIFTDGFDSWWPKTHHISKVEMEKAILEPKLGGRWYEKGVDGSECDWGKVIAWDPYSRFALTWQLTAEYQYDPNFETEIDVRFEPLGSSKTRITLEHKNLERYGDKQKQVMGSIGNEEGGWGGIMKLYAATVDENKTEFEKAHSALMETMAE